MAGVGAAAAALDPSLAPYPLLLAVAKAALGAAAGAYAGQRWNGRRHRNRGPIP